MGWVIRHHVLRIVNNTHSLPGQEGARVKSPTLEYRGGLGQCPDLGELDAFGCFAKTLRVTGVHRNRLECMEVGRAATRLAKVSSRSLYHIALRGAPKQKELECILRRRGEWGVYRVWLSDSRDGPDLRTVKFAKF